MALTKVGPKYQVTIPKAARESLGLQVGDLVEAEVVGHRILLRPKVVVDRDPDLTKDIEEAEADVKTGRVLGPFDSATAALRALKRQSRAHARKGR